MKRSILILLLFLSLAMTSCQKRPVLCCVLPNNPHDMFFTAEKNNQDWKLETGGPLTYQNDTTTVAARGANEVFGLHFKYDGLKTYSLDDGDGLYENITGANNTVLSLYKLDNTFKNEVSITGYDPKQNRITGTFNLKFIKSTNPGSTIYPDTLRFLDGNFTSPLYN